MFHGRAAFDPEVEAIWKEEGRRLRSAAQDRYLHGRQSQASCDPLENLDALAAALRELERLLAVWGPPGLAAGPSARRRFMPGQAATEEEVRRVASLPSLPADWQPDDPGQRANFQKLRKS